MKSDERGVRKNSVVMRKEKKGTIGETSHPSNPKVSGQKAGKSKTYKPRAWKDQALKSLLRRDKKHGEAK